MKDDRRRNSYSDFSSEAGLGLSRREVLRSLAAVGAGAMLPARSLFAQDSRTADGIPTDKTPVAPLTAKGGAIDVHHHYLAPLPGAVGNPHWTPEMSLEVMDKYNIAAALLSLTMQRELFYAPQFASAMTTRPRLFRRTRRDSDCLRACRSPM